MYHLKSSVQDVGVLLGRVHMQSVSMLLPSADKLQEWNRPRPKKLDIIPVADLSSRRHEILKTERKENSLSPSCYDPRPPEHHRVSLEAVEKLRCDLLSLNQPCAFLDILVPSVDKIQHNHCYALPPAANDSTKGIARVEFQLRQYDSSM